MSLTTADSAHPPSTAMDDGSPIMVENPIRERDPRLGRAFEAVALEALREESRRPLHVRFGTSRDDGDAACFVCKVEYAGARGPGRERLPWRWWSPLVHSPRELKDALLRALTAKRRQRGTADEIV